MFCSNCGKIIDENAEMCENCGTPIPKQDMTDNTPQTEDDLYITFKQVSENLGSFAQFKLLFYKDNKIVDTEDGYFSIYAENLNGKDTTDVASIWVWGTDYDRIEYFFEP